MIVELILLALASTIRPTSLAAVYAILSGDAPRRLLTAYVAAGAAFTISVGLIVLLAFDGIQTQPGSGRAKGIAEVAGGVVALAFGVLVLAGRVLGARPDDAPRPPGRWAALRERRLTFRGAVLAGPATHIPGLFYLIALNLIAAYQAEAPRAIAQVLLYNAIWFALPLAALAICIADPDAARRMIAAMEASTREHTRQILLTASFVVGAALVVRGVLAL